MVYERYCQLRDKKGITDYRVSKDTGMTSSLFSDWKAGRIKPGLKSIKTLADYFGVTVDYFLEDEDKQWRKDILIKK